MDRRTLSYRPDIDGLRAIAVLSVVLFHFNKSWLPGGFVGVDIFFVISGYLITGIISKQVERENFSFYEFFIRRALRILPAALTVTASTMVFGAIIMLPADSVSLSKSAIATSLSAANIYFWAFLDTSYFAPSSDMQPLLHMWSLGVEEQFYLLWPAIFICTYKLGGRRSVLALSLVLVVFSMFVAEYYITHDPQFAYYMLPSRAGELLIGAALFLAVSNLNRLDIPRLAIESLSLCGLAMVLGSCFFIREEDGFPGVAALAPTVGAALIIGSGCFGKSAVSYLLSTRPVTSVGLLSFSIYLWHWPVLSFYRYAYGEPEGISAFMCAALILVLSVLSYFFIEKKYRIQSESRKGVRIPFIPTMLTFVISLCAVVIYQKGVIDAVSPASYKTDLTLLFQQTKQASKYGYNCQMNTTEPKFFEREECVLGDLTVRPSMLMFGDSNAAHYVGYMKAVAEGNGFSFRNVSHSGCVPFAQKASALYVAQPRRESCIEFNARVRDIIKDYEVLFVSASWLRTYDEGYIYHLRALVKELAETNKKIIIGLKAPIFPRYDRLCESKSLKIPFMECAQRSTFTDSGEITINRQIEEMAAQYENVSTFSLRPAICPGAVCSPYRDGQPLYYDSNHLSMLGSEMLGNIAVDSGSMPPFVSLMAPSPR